jgi:hypothetical protein
MPIYLSNEQAGTADGKTLMPPAGLRTRGSVVNGRVKRYRATITLAGQVPGDQFFLFTLPPGASFTQGSLVFSTSLGSSTLGIGSLAAPTKYRGQSAGLTTAETPALFSSAAAEAADLSAEEAVYATLGGATLPGSGTLVIDVLVSMAT